MALLLADAWTWDPWFADDGEVFHAFYLKAPRALSDERGRHMRASVGHAVSADLVTWTEVADALVPSDEPAFDDQATWTGSVVRGDDGLWRMFYTGASRSERGLVQRIGVAVSADLTSWRKEPDPTPLEADPRWYGKLDPVAWPDEAWRDPWVVREPTDGSWHMLVTARTYAGPADDRGVIGHAVSTDLATWQVRPPLTAPGAGFGHLETPQVACVDGRWVLVVSCGRSMLAAGRRASAQGGIWVAAAASPTGPFALADAHLLTDETWYSGRLVRRRDGSWVLLAFRGVGPDGGFVGGLSDPMPVSWVDGRLHLTGAAA